MALQYADTTDKQSYSSGQHIVRAVDANGIPAYFHYKTREGAKRRFLQDSFMYKGTVYIPTTWAHNGDIKARRRGTEITLS